MTNDATVRALPDLVQQLSDALTTYDRLVFDEEYDHKLGKPCSGKQLAALEAEFGRPLPPSYWAFLALHNGWSEFAGDAKILAVEDHGSEMVDEVLDDLMEVFSDLEETNPFEEGGFPVMLGDDSDQILYIDPKTVRPDGEMDFVALHLTVEEHRFPDFTAFLSHKLELLREMIRGEVEGLPDDEEDDDDDENLE